MEQGGKDQADGGAKIGYVAIAGLQKEMRGRVRWLLEDLGRIIRRWEVQGAK